VGFVSFLRSVSWIVRPISGQVKLGGWPAWIQSPEKDAPLLAQIASNEEAEMSFVDEGTLYVFASDDGGFEAVLQHY
jgi:hypothetical protein